MASLPLDPDAIPPRLALLFGSGAPGVLAGVNEDDCAVLEWGLELLVITTDFLNARPIAQEFGLGGLHELGRLVVAASLSDLCGTGADPRACLIAATMQRDASEQEFFTLMSGAQEEAARWDVPVVGGDTKLGDSMSVLGVAVGSAKSERNLFLKRNALPGDILWSSGPIGACSAAVAGLSKSVMSDRWRDWAREVITIPDLPLSKSRLLSRSGLGRGGTDVSDGLGADLHGLCTASRVGVLVETDLLPYAPEVIELATHLGIEPWRFAFGIGGDFQFVVTTAPEVEDVVAAMGFHRIGRILDGNGRHRRLPNGTIEPFPAWGHRDARDLSFSDEVDSVLPNRSDVS